MTTTDSIPEPIPVAHSTSTTDQLQSDMDTIRSVLTETQSGRSLHRNIIAIGNIVSGVFVLIAIPFILMVMGIVGVATPETAQGEPSPTLIVGGIGIVVSLFLILISLPFLLTGWGMLKNKSWGDALAMVTAVLNLMNVPLGTALSVYTFWAFTKGKVKVVS